MTHTQHRCTTRQLWQRACDAWSEQLHNTFGSEAGDMRYRKAGQGEPGTPLHTAYCAFKYFQQAFLREERLALE